MFLGFLGLQGHQIVAMGISYSYFTQFDFEMKQIEIFVLGDFSKIILRIWVAGILWLPIVGFPLKFYFG